MRQRKREREKKCPCENKGRENYSAETKQGMPGAIRNWKGKQGYFSRDCRENLALPAP
jgi:hypothetical protein